MRKKLLLAGAMALTALCASAVPACPVPATLTQPDGKTVTLRLVGDEFHNYSVTTDGRTVCQDASGAYVYAEVGADGTLVPTAVLAHDPAQRSEAELAYLALAPQKVVPRPSEHQQTMRSQQLQMAGNPRMLYDYNKFRGLVILVNFTDMKFSYTNAHEIFTDMITKRNYDGFMNNASIPTKEEYTGSVRDYFFDNSRGVFDPAFDVVGPVDIDVASTYPQQTSRMQSVVSKVIAAANPQVDFTKYDTDGDGMVDMFYIIFAGYGSNFQGNNSSYVWPHAWNVSSFNITADGKRMGRYACSTEFYGRPASHYIDGIGTICHEFSHVLGLMDEYDTDYSSGGGQSVDPGEWSVMAGGSYLNKARTPVGYSMMQRYQSGFAVPKVITAAGDYSLRDIDATNDGYRINLVDEDKEYFLLENRRKTGNKWNSYGPGQGMLVFRVDSTSTAPWSSNKINSNPAHNYYQLVRASYNGSSDSGSDPFPGTRNVNSLTAETSPALKGWGGAAPEFGLDSIWETDGVIHFRIRPDNRTRKIEDFENMSTTGRYDQDVQGVWTKWTFNNAQVVETAQGQHKVAMVKGSSLTTAAIPHGWIENASFEVTNNSGSTAFFQLQAEKDGVMTVMSTTTGSTLASVSTGSTSRLNFKIPNLENTRLMLVQKTGDSTSPVHIDNFTIVKDYIDAVQGIYADGTGTLQATVADGMVSVLASPGAAVRLYDLQGRLVASATADSDGRAALAPAARGCYIVSAGGSSLKVLFR